MKTQQLLVAGGVIGGGLLLWMMMKSQSATAGTLPLRGSAATNPFARGSAAFTSATLQPIALPSGIYSSGGALFQSALPAITVASANTQASTWAAFSPTSPPAQSGYVNFPSGSQAAVALLPWRTDGVNFYTNWAGIVYSVPLTPDQYGNLTAVAA